MKEHKKLILVLKEKVLDSIARNKHTGINYIATYYQYFGMANGLFLANKLSGEEFNNFKEWLMEITTEEVQPYLFSKIKRVVFKGQ